MNDTPLLFRFKTDDKHPNGREIEYCHGCYFPLTDLCVTDMGRRGTGKPDGVEWLNEKQVHLTTENQQKNPDQILLSLKELIILLEGLQNADSPTAAKLKSIIGKEIGSEND